MSDKLTLSPRKIRIIRVAERYDWFSMSDISQNIADASLATLRRDLADLHASGVLAKKGEKKGVRYSLIKQSKLFLPFDLGEYYRQDVDTRQAEASYDFDTFPSLAQSDLFTDDQIKRLDSATNTYHANSAGPSSTLYQKELERFVIEFSWKSSKIEGNTCTLLDTEFLLRNGVEAKGRSKYETKMILNHKKAYLFVVEAARTGVQIDASFVQHIHKLISDGLGIEPGVRNRIIGISGSNYTPLTIHQQLREQLDAMINAINSKSSPYEQALMAVLGTSYLQPFEDGNKRTSRVFANSLLLRSNYAPLSYRSVDEREYKEATLIFYEQGSIIPFRELFVDQYIYSATNYNTAQFNSIKKLDNLV